MAQGEGLEAKTAKGQTELIDGPQFANCVTAGEHMADANEGGVADGEIGVRTTFRLLED